MILLIKALVWTVVSFLIIALALFLPAGTVLWPAGWVFLILLLGFTLVNIGLLFTSSPGLLEERLSLSQPGQKNLGQGAHITRLPARSCLGHADATGRGEISLVARASFPPDRRSHYPDRLVSSRDPDLSGKRVPVASSAYSGRTGTNGDLHQSLSLCAPSAVCQRDPLLSRNASAARIVVRLAIRPGPDRLDGGACRAGGACVA